MTVIEHQTPPAPDLFSLANAPVGTLLEALSDERTLADRGEVAPPRALQIAELILAEVVRLIRLGTGAELDTAALELAQARISRVGTELKQNLHEVYELLSAAALAVGAATAPSSAGSEVALLRGWNGAALEAVAAVSQAPNRSLARSELRKRLGNVDESYLSHLLSDLEAAGLIVRIREGRTVTVHLGPTGRQEHVRKLLPQKPAPFWSSHQEEGASSFLDKYERVLSRNLESHHLPLLNQQFEFNHFAEGPADEAPEKSGAGAISSPSEHEFALDSNVNVLNARPARRVAA